MHHSGKEAKPKTREKPPALRDSELKKAKMPKKRCGNVHLMPITHSAAGSEIPLILSNCVK